MTSIKQTVNSAYNYWNQHSTDDNKTIEEMIKEVKGCHFISIEGKQLQEIPSEILENKEMKTELDVLMLKHNKIKYINSDIYINLSNLKCLDLSFNLIKEIPSELFYIKTLIGVDLSNNKIEKLPLNMYNCTELIVLNLYKNEIKTVQKNISQLTNLTRLDIGDNYISSLSGLSELSKLTKLTCMDNKFTEITNDLPPNLKILQYQRNKISKIGERLFELTDLTELNLERNMIKTKEISEISKLKNLNVIQLTSNFIEEMKDISELTKLTRIELGRNRIKEFMRFPYSIKYIDLRGNKISKLIVFRNYKNLQYLNLNHNELVEFNTSISENLEILRLENNFLNFIDFNDNKGFNKFLIKRYYLKNL
jgi:internalin A